MDPAPGSEMLIRADILERDSADAGINVTNHAVPGDSNIKLAVPTKNSVLIDFVDFSVGAQVALPA